MSHAQFDSDSSLHISPASPEPTAQRRSFLESFLDSFFQEKNIKWMLIVGAGIVLGSSLMLVTKAWPEWPTSLKFLTILGYTGAIFVAAETGRTRLRLNATYRVLHALTLLLLPVCFLSLTWLSPGSAIQSSLSMPARIGLLIPAIALMWIASTRILDHWLHGRQTTFLISYWMLCIAGALPPLNTPIQGLSFVVIAWLVFTVGVVKVNRHTFWLAEEHRLPRVFGFLPIILLGLQFMVLVAAKAGSLVPLHWLGVVILMTSATVLVTARTVTEVFRRRTGDLVRPLPWPIIVPLFSGLVFTVLGLTFSFSGFHYVGQTTYAVIPAALIAATLFALVAKDTRHSGLVWASMIATAIAYQCSPTMFSEVVQSLREATASAINQQRVPISMYGLTYIPFLVLMAAVSRYFSVRGKREFSQPIKHFVTIVAMALLAISVTDFVSLFFVSIANVVAFGIYAVAFRDRRYILPAVATLVIGCGSAIPAMNDMQYANFALDWIPTALAGLAVALTLFALPDRLLNRIPIASSGRFMQFESNLQTEILSSTGRNLALLVSIFWVGVSVIRLDDTLTSDALIQYSILGAALIVSTIRKPHYLMGTGFWILLLYVTLRGAIASNMNWNEIAGTATWLFALTSTLGYLSIYALRAETGAEAVTRVRRTTGMDLETFSVCRVEALPNSWLHRLATFSMPMLDLSRLGMLLLAMSFHLPQIIYQHGAYFTGHHSAGTQFSLLTLLMIGWLLGTSVFLRSRLASIATVVALPFAISAMVIASGMSLTFGWMFAIWAVTASIMLLVHTYLANRRDKPATLNSMQDICLVWLWSLLAVSCVSLEPQLRIVAVICTLALVGAFHWRTWSRENLCKLAIIANINMLAGVASLAGCQGWLFPGLIEHNSSVCIPWIFMVASLSVLVFGSRPGLIACEACHVWASILRVGVGMFAILAMMDAGISSPAIVAMMIGFAILVIAELSDAVHEEDEFRVWIAVCISAGSVAFLCLHEVIVIGAGVSQYVLLGVSIVGLSVAQLAQRRSRLQILARPMRLIGLVLPAAVASFAIGRVLTGSTAVAAPLNSLALMIAAGIYFHQAIVQSNKKYILPALLIANAGLLLLWISLRFNAPELYLVPVGISILWFAELMKQELPETAQDPLRYIAALTILCSPLLEVIGGDWLHILTLMVLSVSVILVAIGLRIRALVYAGSAFLFADLVAMVIRSTSHNLNLLWICGVLLGAAVIALAAFCENHRDNLLAKIRGLSAELATWN